MAKITRYSGNVAPFASTAQAGERLLFGDSSATGDTLDQNINPNWLRGWGVVGPNDFPPLEWFNSAMYSSTLLASYLYQVGIAEWNIAQEYHKGSIANVGGVLYASLTNNNIGNDPTADTVNWKEFKTELDISGLPAKTTPADTDNLALQETGGLLKKLSWLNLKNTLFEGTISLTGNGYIKFPTIMGGLIIQWGTASQGYGSVVNFPIAFPNAALQAVAVSSVAASNSFAIVTNLTSTQITLANNNNGGTMRWIALGY